MCGRYPRWVDPCLVKFLVPWKALENEARIWHTKCAPLQSHHKITLMILQNPALVTCFSSPCVVLTWQISWQTIYLGSHQIWRSYAVPVFSVHFQMTLGVILTYRSPRGGWSYGPFVRRKLHTFSNSKAFLFVKPICLEHWFQSRSFSVIPHMYRVITV